MRIETLGCFGAQTAGCRVTSFLINDDLLLDAGAAAAALNIIEQAAIKNICLTHTHLDHIKGVMFLADNRMTNNEMSRECIRVWGIKELLDILKKHVLNGLIWPDFSIIPNKKNPVLKLCPLKEGEKTCIDGYYITAVKVNHPGCAVGYILEYEGKTLIYTGDTGPTERIWEIANKIDNIVGIIIEVSFPNRLRNLAEVSQHLTPELMKKELSKLAKCDVPIFTYHMKPQYLDEIRSEIKSLNNPMIQILGQNKVYRF